MNNKILLVVVLLLLFGGVFVFAKNQNKMAPSQEVNEEIMEDVTEEDVTEEGDDEAEATAVSVTAAGFEPQSITVKAGSKVVWTNNTDATANVSSAMHPTHELYPPLNLGDFEAGATLELVFDEPGTYKYHDHLNPSKFGTVVVE